MTPGKRYQTMCVRACLNSISPPEWIPVIGPPHDDAKTIGFKPVHLHIDWRFLGPRQRAKVLAFGKNAPHDIVIQTVYPDDDSEPIDLDQALANGKLPVRSFLKSKKKTYHGPFLPYPQDPPPYWMKALSNAYRNAALTADRSCPHRGTDLSEIELDEQGIITCPLHGLRWCAETGAAAPMADETVTNP